MKPSSSPLPLSRRAALAAASLGGLGLVAGRLPSAAQSATPAGTPLALPPLIQLWQTVWQTDPSQAATLYTPDAVLEDVPSGTSTQGLAAFAAAIQADQSGFPDRTYTMRSGFVAGDWAAAEVIFRGTYAGQYSGLPPGNGKPVELHGALIFQLAQGKIVRESHYYDTATLLTELGFMPAPMGMATPAATPNA